ncbi:MAG TPA: carboxypeptidase regulatory-like domain-containing protein [Candidatus Binatia bacterium]|nr:carboxypeptidase regulatory-like domain-containing protein [Candidatus Binatia bacterium]
MKPKPAALFICLLALCAGRHASAQIAGSGEALGAPGSGRLVGRVAVAGEFPKPKPLAVYKSRDFCGRFVANETLLVGTDGGLRNAVITLHSMDPVARAAPQRVILDNKKCAFVPHVQVALVGSELWLKNSDPILHAVHARLGRETLFNVGLPRWREVIKRLDRPGVVRIDCDVLHTWMSAAIVVTTTPYFAVTDASGRFSIDGLPPGEYRADIWHERLGAKTARLTVTPEGSVALDVVYGSN